MFPAAESVLKIAKEGWREFLRFYVHLLALQSSKFETDNRIAGEKRNSEFPSLIVASNMKESYILVVRAANYSSTKESHGISHSQGPVCQLKDSDFLWLDGLWYHVSLS